jgi:hypothetical protein
MNITINFYNNALGFALNIVRQHDLSSFIDKKDIVHDVITDTNFNENNCKSLVVSYVYRYKQSKFIYPIDAVPKNKDRIEHRYCKYCDMVMPEDYFISGYNTKTNEFQYRTVCKVCHRKTDKVKQQRKRYYEKNKETLIAKNKERRKNYIDTTAKERYLRWKLKKKLNPIPNVQVA